MTSTPFLRSNAFIRIRQEELLPLVGSRPDSIFDAIRNDWWLVRIKEGRTEKMRKLGAAAGVQYFVPGDEPEQREIARTLARCHDAFIELAQWYKDQKEREQFDLKGLTSVEIQRLTAGK